MILSVKNILLATLTLKCFLSFTLEIFLLTPQLKKTTSSLDNHFDTSSESSFRRLPCHCFILLYSRNPTHSLANSSLLRHHAQSLSSDSRSSHDIIQTSGVDTFSQRSSICSFNTTGHLFSQITSRNRSVLSSDSYLQSIDVSTDQCSTTPAPNSKSQTSLSRFEMFLECKIFCNNSTLLFTSQYPGLFIKYKEGFNKHTGKRNPLQLPEDRQYNELSSQVISSYLK